MVGTYKRAWLRRNTRENSSNQNHHRVMMGHTCPFSFSLRTNPGLAKASFIVHDALPWWPTKFCGCYRESGEDAFASQHKDRIHIFLLQRK